jgi:hypothetical protein
MQRNGSSEVILTCDSDLIAVHTHTHTNNTHIPTPLQLSCKIVVNLSYKNWKLGALKKSQDTECARYQFYNDFIQKHGRLLDEVEIFDLEWLRDPVKSSVAAGPLTTLIRSAENNDLPKLLALLASTLGCDYSKVPNVGPQKVVFALQSMVEQKTSINPENFCSVLVANTPVLSTGGSSVLDTVWVGFACYVHPLVLDLTDPSIPKAKHLFPINGEVPQTALDSLGELPSQEPVYIHGRAIGEIDPRSPDVLQLQNLMNSCTVSFNQQTQPQQLSEELAVGSMLTEEEAKTANKKKLKAFLQWRGWSGESTTNKADLLKAVLKELEIDKTLKSKHPGYKPELRNPNGQSAAEFCLASGKVGVQKNSQFDPKFTAPHHLDPSWTSLPLLGDSDVILVDITNEWMKATFVGPVKRKDAKSKALVQAERQWESVHGNLPELAMYQHSKKIVWLKGAVFASWRTQQYTAFAAIEVRESNKAERLLKGICECEGKESGRCSHVATVCLAVCYQRYPPPHSHFSKYTPTTEANKWRNKGVRGETSARIMVTPVDDIDFTNVVRTKPGKTNRRNKATPPRKMFTPVDPKLNDAWSFDMEAFARQAERLPNGEQTGWSLCAKHCTAPAIVEEPELTDGLLEELLDIDAREEREREGKGD